jgi:nucleotide-binding universal stress UspA family protein
VELRRILIPVKGYETDAEAVELACRMAKPVKGRIHVIYVIEVDRTLPLDAEITPEIAKGENVLAKAERVAVASDYQVETDLLQAREVGPAVVDEAIERDVDLIVMGLPYKRRFGEFNLGKTTPYVLKNAPCRVLVVRQPI